MLAAQTAESKAKQQFEAAEAAEATAKKHALQASDELRVAAN